MDEGFLKALLHDVFSVLTVAGYAKNYRKDLCVVTLHENAKSPSFATFAGVNQNGVRPFDEIASSQLARHLSSSDLRIPPSPAEGPA